jgi:hypothetical protein
MRRMALLWGVILLIISVALVSYAKMEKIAISKDNLADLKGNWTGSRTIGTGERLNTDFEISSDGLPVQGKFTFYDIRRRGKTGTTLVIDFKKGKINDQGNLLIANPNLEAELSLSKDDGKMKLEGNFSWAENRGTLSFKKK